MKPSSLRKLSNQIVVNCIVTFSRHEIHPRYGNFLTNQISRFFLHGHFHGYEYWDFGSERSLVRAFSLSALFRFLRSAFCAPVSRLLIDPWVSTCSSLNSLCFQKRGFYFFSLYFSFLYLYIVNL